jgi:nitrate/nitrite transport system ATP-binding protein
MPFLEVQNVSKSFPNAHGSNDILRNIDLSIEEGEFVAIVGYSGSGKTTLISILAGLLEPDSGDVILDGARMEGPGPDRGLVFQNYSLLPWLTVFENVQLAVDQVYPDWSDDRRAEHTDKYVTMVNLARARNKLPRELSGGMRQRVSVARTLAMNPRILLLDEPLSALDALTRATLQDELARLWLEDRKTVVLITNDPDEALLLADRVIPLTRGPGATLAKSIPVTLPRPRDRRTLNLDPEFKRLRLEVLTTLINAGARPKATLHRELILPDIEPEDLNAPKLPGRRKTPIRRSERVAHDVEVGGDES